MIKLVALFAAMQHVVNSNSDSGSSYGYEAMFAIPSSFYLPLNDAEMALLAASSSSECEEFEPTNVQQSSAGASSLFAQQSRPSPQAMQPLSSEPGRRKYSRENGKGVRHNWKHAAQSHMQSVRTATIFGRDTCSVDCCFNKQCLKANFTPTMLHRCAAETFGEMGIGEETDPKVRNHRAVRVWFQLVYRCCVMLGSTVTSIDDQVEGHRVCAGTFAAVYAIPSST
eukprot:6213497-Pleurochrysis_carterae.AAC.1